MDTSVWVDHLRIGNPDLATRLNAERVLTHPFVIGELALGNLQNRATVLTRLEQLPRALTAEPDEVLVFIQSAALWGQGIGYVDVHLLAATRLTPDTQLWTLDRRLHAAATRLGLAA